MVNQSLAEVSSICHAQLPSSATGSAAVGRLELDELAAEQLQVVWPEGMGAELLRIVATIYASHKTVETYPGSCAASLVSAPKTELARISAQRSLGLARGEWSRYRDFPEEI
jgi:hypothetical protein